MISNSVIFILLSYMETWFIESKSNKFTSRSLVNLSWVLNLSFMFTIATIDTGHMNKILHAIFALIFFLGAIPYMMLNNYLINQNAELNRGKGLFVKRIITVLYIANLVWCIYGIFTNPDIKHYQGLYEYPAAFLIMAYFASYSIDWKDYQLEFEIETGISMNELKL